MASDATIEQLGRLIGFDTTSRNSNLDLIDYVETYLATFGIACERTPDASGAKSNLFATIGPAERPGYVLSGHTDVVPVDGQDWTYPPFSMSRADGKLFGRGACDMKGFLAVSLALVPEMVAAKLAAPIHFAFSYDEEVGCIGVRDLLAELLKRPVRPAGCIVGEPTSMQVVIGHKAKRSLRLCAHGLAGHSSRAPECVNAVEYAAELVTRTTAIGRRFAASGPRDPLYDIPFSTAHVGVFRGGSAVNIVPSEATVDLEFRTLPEDDLAGIVAEISRAAAELSEEMRARDAGSGITVEQISEIPGLAMAPEDDIVTLAKRFAGRNDHAKVAYGTEAGLFVEIGRIPTVVCGPGSIGEAHKPDEFVTEDQLAKCEDFVRGLIRHCEG
ncbi:acetylornithine deacetylase [Methylopila sp. M107]|uniref:acetylornithine deacetylase n=1 Tax=Methylopila sp. M107 TaxID=1101190 RepID=UPI00037EA547|nr:acetylornithine deacetylase [Methylopila sp. M107]